MKGEEPETRRFPCNTTKQSQQYSELVSTVAVASRITLLLFEFLTSQVAGGVGRRHLAHRRFFMARGALR
jgi:hypothetical protein